MILQYTVLIGLKHDRNTAAADKRPKNSHVPFTYGVSVSAALAAMFVPLTLVYASQLSLVN